MISLFSRGMRRCCYDVPTCVNKSISIDEYAPRIDLVVGVILCIIGTLALHGVIPMASAGADWIVAAGSLQIIFSVILDNWTCCKTIGNLIKHRDTVDLHSMRQSLEELGNRASERLQNLNCCGDSQSMLNGLGF